jgi:hypothetical protein
MVTMMVMAVLAQTQVALDDDSWTAMTPPPAETAVGSALVSCMNTLYAARGGGSREFWAYLPSSDEWLPCPDVPFPMANGGAMATDGSTAVYAACGDQLARYAVAENNWSLLVPLPAPMGSGGCLTWTEGTIFVLRGGNSTDFWRVNEAIQTIEALGGLTQTFSYGANVICDGTGKLIMLRGNNSLSWGSYDPSIQLWNPNPPLPATVTAGSSLTLDGEALYLFRGGGSKLSWRCVDGVTWQPWIPAPVPCESGTSMAVRGGMMYLLAGKAQSLWRAMMPRRPEPPVVPGAEPPAEGGSEGRRCAASAAPGGPWFAFAPLFLAALAVRMSRRQPWNL